MNNYAENLRRSIINTTKRFKEMNDELKAKQDAADRKEIIRMAREAGYGDAMSDLHAPALERFAILVAAAEREACARVCEERFMGEYTREANLCASAIREMNKFGIDAKNSEICT